MQPRAPDHGDSTPEGLFARYRDSGDERAFSALYDAFGRKLFAIAVRSFRARHGGETARAMASDAVQETWTRVVRKRHQWDATRGGFTPWLMSIHFHCLVDMARRAAPRGKAGSALPEEDGTRAAPGPERRLLALQAFDQLLERLGPDDAAVLTTYYLVENTRMVSASIGISDAGLRKRIERLKEKVRSEPKFARLLEELGIGTAGLRGRDE